MNLKDYIQQNKEAFDNEQISNETDINFQNLLKQKMHKPKQQVYYLKYISIAASVLIVFTVYLMFNNKENLNKEKQLLLSNLEAESAGKRLEGVYKFSDEYASEDKKIINRLTTILLNDKNFNVKIATIEALLKFPKNEKIRKTFINALEKESEPLVQIKLIKAVSFLRENRAQKPLEKIINSELTYPIVKNNATLAMSNIKQ